MFPNVHSVLGFVVRSSAVLLLCAPYVGCGDDDNNNVADAGGSTGGDGGGGGGETFTFRGTLVPVLATDTTAPIANPHLIELLSPTTGLPLVPPITSMSAPVTGAIDITGPKGRLLTYVHGAGTGENSTVDTVLDGDASKYTDPLVRISSKGLAGLAQGSGDYTPMPDRASMFGAIYWVQNGARKGTVACAKVYIDGATAPDLDQSQRYTAASGLPVPLAMQSETGAGGVFYFGNAKVGAHTLKVSLDDGKTMTTETPVYIPFPNSAAKSEQKSVSVQMAIYMEANSNPTLPTCMPK